MIVMRNYSFWKWVTLGMLTMALIILIPSINYAYEGQWEFIEESRSDGQWKLGGQNIRNTRYQAEERIISRDTVKNLSPKWVFETSGDVYATPAVLNGALYVPDWSGSLYKINSRTGTKIWSRTIASYTDNSIDSTADSVRKYVLPNILSVDPGFLTAVSRTTPAIAGNKIVIGTQKDAYLIAINKDTGDLIWKTKLDEHPAAVITQSPTIYNNRIYVGLSSQEEGLAANPEYPCCTFRGSMSAVDLKTGKILWKTYTVPDNHNQPGGYSGAAVWGSTPAIDPKRNLVYIATGNNYDVPQAAKDCITSLSSSTPSDQSQCLDSNNYIDAILALDLDTGAVKWSNKFSGYDTWTVACLGGSALNCPDPKGPDYDFGQAPMLITIKNNGKPRDLVGAGQKSGIFWALDPDTGKVVWSRIVGPGGSAGGMQWGSATDGKQIYVAIANSDFKEYTLKPSCKKITGGSWSALDAATGKIIWQTADPAGATDKAPVTIANGVVYGGSSASGTGKNNMYALDAKTGDILWSFNSGGSVIAGASVVDGTVYWGSGYSRFGLGKSNNKLYAFRANS